MREQGREYFNAKRELANTTRIRDTILLRVMQEEVDLELPKESTVEIIDDADLPIRAVRPNIPLNISLGVVVGLILGVGLAFFIEYLDTSVKTIDDVERALGAAVLGVILKMWVPFWRKGMKVPTRKRTGCCAPTSFLPVVSLRNRPRSAW